VYINHVINAGVKGNLTKAASTGVRYFSANFGEGIQETKLKKQFLLVQKIITLLC
jgi:hypothetical protein